MPFRTRAVPISTTFATRPRTAQFVSPSAILGDEPVSSDGFDQRSAVRVSPDSIVTPIARATGIRSQKLRLIPRCEAEGCINCDPAGFKMSQPGRDSFGDIGMAP
jgi:hypothetical protein